MTGGTGFLGTRVVARLAADGVDVVGVGRRDADLREPGETAALFREARPGAVVHLAGLVGGIGIHEARAADLVRENVLMGLHALEAARQSGAYRFILAGTAAAYPETAPVPSPEEALTLGLPTGTSRPYALAKRTVEEALNGYRTQHGMGGGTLVFTNLYGPGDHFGAEAGHVVAALVPRFVEAAREDRPDVLVWGTGQPTRDFLFVDDGARAVALALHRLDAALPVNVGSGRETSIRELAEALARVVGFRGRLDFDETRPDGAPRRCLQVDRARALLDFAASTALEDGLRLTVEGYEHRLASGAGSPE